MHTQLPPRHFVPDGVGSGGVRRGGGGTLRWAQGSFRTLCSSLARRCPPCLHAIAPSRSSSLAPS
eukprot:8207160-Alexandrium_andersonii.AAC.1